ncbi:2091_t:CDS:2 [Racocetra persica]|uniref:2091_t:CDS:1 n=1 Tax=Racocetra persica TaxID=160502 RepID=A0ACA9PHG6_9GLOM|nr:2091_t:CDS:2 [Racocetra persica]
MKEGVPEIVAQRKAVKNANKILIIGGDPKMTDLAKQLRELNENLIFGEKIIFPSSGIGDAFGTKPNTKVIETLDKSLIEKDTALVKVKPTLQLDHDNNAHIFVLGDIKILKKQTCLSC